MTKAVHFENCNTLYDFWSLLYLPVEFEKFLYPFPLHLNNTEPLILLLMNMMVMRHEGDGEKEFYDDEL